MKHAQQHNAQLGAQLARQALWLGVASALTGCTHDMSLGDLSGRHFPVEDSASAATPAPLPDGLLPEQLPPPDLTMDNSGAQPPANVGDLDGDGFDDMAAVQEDLVTGVRYVRLRYGGPRPQGAGAAFAFHEGGARLVVGDLESTYLVTNVARAGDLDGDGHADLVVSTEICDTTLDSDGAFVVYGGTERLEGTLALADVAAHFRPPQRSVEIGTCSAMETAAGADFDGDGLPDLAFVNPGQLSFPDDDAGRTDQGVYLFYGRAERFPRETAWTEADAILMPSPGIPVTASGQPELRLCPSGDLDGDGKAELLVSYLEFDQEGNRLIIVPGAERRSGTVDLLGIEPQLRDAYIGVTVPRAVGDLDGDGMNELLVSTLDFNHYLFYGAPELLSSPLDLSQASAQLAGEQGTVSLVPIGDRDGDGDDELLMVRSVSDEAQQIFGLSATTISGTRTRKSGAIAVIPGPADPSSNLSAAAIYDVPDRYLVDAEPIGDLDGDGAQDLVTISLIQDAQADGGFFASGSALHVHYGIPVSSLPEPR
jgi:hypothetical protein